MKGAKKNASKSETSLGTSLKKKKGGNYYLNWMNFQFNNIEYWLYCRVEIQSKFFQGKEVIFATFHCTEETISNFVHSFLVSVFWKEISADMELGLKGEFSWKCMFQEYDQGKASSPLFYKKNLTFQKK